MNKAEELLRKVTVETFLHFNVAELSLCVFSLSFKARSLASCQQRGPSSASEDC